MGPQGDSASEWQVDLRAGGDAIHVRGAWEPLQGHGHFATRLNAPAIPGLEVELIEGPVPALFVRNETGEVLSVAGGSGEPLLRIGPDGVWANVRSPSYFTAAAQVIKQVPASADPSAPPHWRRLSTQPLWGWLEYRAAVPAHAQERDSLGAERATVLTWRSPMQLSGRALDVGGYVEWVPSASLMHHSSGGVSSTVMWTLAALLVAVGLFYLTPFRLRKRVA